MILMKHFFISAMAVIGFSVVFNIPQKSIPKAALAGALGWITFVYFNEVFNSTVGASFMGACVVASVSEIFARIFQEAITVFIIPAIIPLVPGSGMYYSMLAIIEDDYSRFASVSSETLFIAGSISVAILLISSITRIIMNIKMKRQKS